MSEVKKHELREPNLFQQHVDACVQPCHFEKGVWTRKSMDDTRLIQKGNEGSKFSSIVRLKALNCSIELIFNTDFKLFEN